MTQHAKKLREDLAPAVERAVTAGASYAELLRELHAAIVAAARLCPQPRGGDGGNKSELARRLGVSRSVVTLWRREAKEEN